jgi:MFS family permease
VVALSSLLLSYLAFLGISLPDGLFGVAWPSMSRDLGVPLGALGLMLPLGVASSMLSSASTGVLLARIGLGRLLATSIAVTGVALLTQSVAPVFWVVVATGVLIAAGNGAIDAGLNANAARRFTARQITWMHAVYGFGAAVGPLLFAGMAGFGLSWRWTFAVVAAVQGLLAVLFAATARTWAPAPPSTGGQAVGGRAVDGRAVDGQAVGGRAVDGRPGVDRGGFRMPAVFWPGAALFAVQTGVESATALWAFVFLTGARGVSLGVAAATVSGYWAALLVGRLVLGPVADRTGARPVLLVGLAGMAGGAALLLVPSAGAALAGIVLIGLSAAPMYPLLMLTTKDRVGADLADRAVGVQGAASALGSATMPALIGLLIGPLGAAVIAPCVLLLALATATAYRVATR